MEAKINLVIYKEFKNEIKGEEDQCDNRPSSVTMYNCMNNDREDSPEEIQYMTFVAPKKTYIILFYNYGVPLTKLKETETLNFKDHLYKIRMNYWAIYYSRIKTF